MKAKDKIALARARAGKQVWDRGEDKGNPLYSGRGWWTPVAAGDHRPGGASVTGNSDKVAFVSLLRKLKTRQTEGEQGESRLREGEGVGTAQGSCADDRTTYEPLGLALVVGETGGSVVVVVRGWIVGWVDFDG
ncbi:hypothetical protein HPP92_015823 [Vanilla planifolia]|uniref:Uncharacterized protein n=1 Tax=Vanilla planifolia TaxID=51239 RepID=A0A835PCB4_VANPL|nr:hypothetical protein HPP92_027222 [Vanilla planifolia]KAG0471277.1 hypothetical protein HPP92_015823 [Vanilla planifolia]